MEQRLRANKKQKELLIERLHANMNVARGNIADPLVREFWARVVEELNMLGCQRTVEQWQHIWNVWRAKIKTKARKVRESINGTGGGPASPGLTDLDNKILEIVGVASVYGFVELELGLPTQQLSQPGVETHTAPEQGSSSISQERLDQLPLEQPHQSPLLQCINATRGRPNRRRRQRLRPARAPISDNLIRALANNSSLLREAIQDVGTNVAAAIRSVGVATIRAAEIMANAISGMSDAVENP